MMALTKWPDDFHPASVKPIEKGDDAILESGCTRSSEVDGQINPWKKDMPMKTIKIRYRIDLVAFEKSQLCLLERIW
jgi:hypothetical protein